MDIKSITQLLKSAQESDFDKVEIQDGDFSLKLERNAQQVMVPVAAPFEAAPVPVMAHEAEPQAAPDATGVLPRTANAEDILSPLVGIFHELPGNKKLKIGDKKKKGDPVCTIEAMKLMNEITMPDDGTIEWIAVEEGATVEYEQLLFTFIKE